MSDTTSRKCSLAELNAFSAGDFVARFGGVFEHSPWIAETAAQLRPFESVADLHEKMTMLVAQSSPEAQLALIEAHPDLAGRLAKMGQLTAESTNEQAAAGLAQADVATIEKISTLNAAYRERFGFPFIICARLNNVTSIVEAMTTRLPNDRSTEIDAALTEIYKIAQLRLGDIVEA
ncbi:2-oxo-4-hydroxy-4-carboxy-5-ureidoimidazoline decarboxylase [soil metagenome]